MGIEVAGALAGMAMSYALAPKAPNIPNPPAPAAPPQPSQMPDMNVIRRQIAGAGQGGGAPGIGQTMLTGPGGVDPNQLTLGKNTLLGG